MTWYFSRRRNETQRRFSESHQGNLSDAVPGGSGYLGLTRRWFTRAYWEREAEANMLSDTIKTCLQDLESRKQTVAQEQKALQEVLGCKFGNCVSGILIIRWVEICLKIAR